jgi:MinD superfamily P-loop ATPase
MVNNIEKIAITGGKGGTGKSTVAVLMANKLNQEGKKVVLVDCDVECPNDHLLIKQELEDVIAKSYISFPKLDKSKCTKCGLCVKKCRENAIFQKPGDYPIFIKDLCTGCGLCWNICPFGAIKPEKEVSGEIFLNKIRKDFWLVTGQARSGLEETGPVVAETKKAALQLAQEKRADLVLFDTAAGAHCPVINALMDTDMAYCVTEPTPMGAYDLELILDLVKKLGITPKVIINQSDLGDKSMVMEVIKQFNVPLEREIPYSKALVKAYSRGELLTFKDF